MNALPKITQADQTLSVMSLSKVMLQVRSTVGLNGTIKAKLSHVSEPLKYYRKINPELGSDIQKGNTLSEASNCGKAASWVDILHNCGIQLCVVVSLTSSNPST